MNNHPRIALLRKQVRSLLIDEQYRSDLLQSIDTYAEQIIARQQYTPSEGLDDLEALQQTTLSDRVERSLDAMISRRKSIR